jgi:hypothetical protein
MKKILIKTILGCCLYALLPIAGNSQNFVDATNDASIVPIQLISFKAALQGNNVQVSWSTATEINNSHFNVLRSLNGKDFSSIGTIQGKGNTVAVSNYSLVDASFPKQNLYYQLEQVDFDGKKTLSSIVLVKIDGNQVQVTVFPNPVKDKKLSLLISNITEGNYTISVLDIAGTKVYSQQLKVIGNVPSSIQLPQQLQVGIYMLQVMNGAATVKLTKQLFIN